MDAEAGLVALAMVLADHFERRDDAFAKAGESKRARYLAAASAVQESIRLGITSGTMRRAKELVGE